MKISEKLAELGLELPAVAAPVAAYLPALKDGELVMTSGQLPLKDGELVATGVMGTADAPSVEEAAQAARQCALNAIAAAAEVAGGVDNLAAAIKVTGFVASAPDFNGQPQVINGASELLAEVFGSGHARSAVGVAALPLNASCEVEVTFRLA
ncbi:LysR family transcriptional regulator [Boudabousia tangfeifanii]|uniref:LysR family transcriptional regulator n=1 Tax=Boudabousia tangfeifanii TaxID=1912795 RepID=A0A1D9MI59_9ACTO|nr:RidA family protein [Boudabousia tangfeifanii]AOZ71974.1 LysR family transcriptional regulator [Boudabousia tangfeifanii]